MARMMAECIPSTTSWVGVMLMSVKPARVRPSRYSVKDSAPAMYPMWRPRSARSAWLRWSSARMSETPNRPPGRSTRELSARTAALLPDRVDHAVGDDHVDRFAGQRDRFDMAVEEFGVGGAGLGGVVPGEVQHLVGHVQAVGLTGGADPAGGQQHVDAAAGTQVEDRLAGLEAGDGDRVTAAQTGRYRVFRYFALLGRAVQLAAGSGLVVALAGITAGRIPAAGDSVGGLGVPGPYPLADFRKFI